MKRQSRLHLTKDTSILPQSILGVPDVLVPRCDSVFFMSLQWEPLVAGWDSAARSTAFCWYSGLGRPDTIRSVILPISCCMSAAWPLIAAGQARYGIRYTRNKNTSSQIHHYLLFTPPYRYMPNRSDRFSLSDSGRRL